MESSIRKAVKKKITLEKKKTPLNDTRLAHDSITCISITNDALRWTLHLNGYFGWVRKKKLTFIFFLLAGCASSGKKPDHKQVMYAILVAESSLYRVISRHVVSQLRL